MNPLLVGAPATAETTIRNKSGAPTNVTTAVLKLLAPTGAVTEPSPTNSATGVYVFDFTPTAIGTWWFLAGYLLEGHVVPLEEGSFQVEGTRF